MSRRLVDDFRLYLDSIVVQKSTNYLGPCGRVVSKSLVTTYFSLQPLISQNTTRGKRLTLFFYTKLKKYTRDIKGRDR